MEKKQEILKDVSFEVKDGEMLVVTGPNGGGQIHDCQTHDGAL